MQRRARLLLVFAVVMVALAIIVVAAWAPLVRLVVVSGIRSATGGDVSASEIHLNVFHGRFTLSGLRVADRQTGQPYLALERLDTLFRVLPLVRGRIHLEQITLARPRIDVVRDPSGRFNVADLIERFSKPATGEPANVVIGRVVIDDGSVTFQDQSMAGTPAWRLGGLAVEVRDLATRSSEPRGTVNATFTLAGAPATLRVDGIALHPVRAHATLVLTDLDLTPAWIYIPVKTAVRPARGRFSTRLTVDYSPDGVRAGGDARLADFALFRRDHAEPLLTTPALTMTSRDIVYRNGALSAARLELAGAASVVDTSTGTANRFDVTGTRLVVEDVTYPTKKSARVSFAANLPAGATLNVNGTGEVYPTAADVQVALAGLDLALTKPYLPRDAYVTLGGGTFGTTLSVGYSRDGVIRVSGDAQIAGLTMLRKDQSEPLVTEPMITVNVDDFQLADGAMTAGRVRVSGAPTIVDATVSPPARFAFTSNVTTIENASWPSRGPARVRIDAAEGGSTLALRGTFDAGTLAAEARARFTGVDLTRVVPYLPPASPMSIARGIANASMRLGHDRATGVRLSGDAFVTDLAVIRRGEREPFLLEPRLGLTITDAVVKGPAVSVGQAIVIGAPAFIDAAMTPSRRVDLGVARIEVNHLAVPGTGPAQVGLDLTGAGGGTLAIRGSVTMGTRAADLAVDAKDLEVTPYAPLLPITGPVSGRLGAKLTVSASFADGLVISARGDASSDALAIGPGTTPPLTVSRLAVTGLDVRWPGAIKIETIRLGKPYVLVERDRNGNLPLRAMLSTRSTASASPPADQEASRPPAPTTAGGTSATSPPTTIEIGRIVIEDGAARFVDRTTTPAFSEDVSRLALTVTGVKTVPDSRADVALQAIVGARGALELHGQMALGTPYYVDLQGELRDLSIAPTNPYIRHYAGWVASSGSLTTKLHYRVVGDDVELSNDVLVQRIKVERAPADDANAARRVGLPLGMIVAIITDSHGDIHFNVPVTGKLSAPDFSFGDAIWAAVKNVLVNVAAAPFRAIGKMFGGGRADDPEQFHVDPVRFEPGSASFDAEGEKQIQRVADFLRASPYVKLSIASTVTAADVATLKTQAVVERVQRLQRERKLPDFTAAAGAAFKAAFPDRPAPPNPDAAVAALRERETVPDEATHGLAARRLAAALRALVDNAGIEPQRLLAPDAPKTVPADGEGRVEFELRP